jgi:heme exporter protein B
MKAVRALFARELSLAWGGGGGPLLACGFLLCLTAILPLAAGGDPRVLAPAASGASWMALALASLLSLERMFERDLDDGALDLLATGPLPLEALVAIKALAQWLATGLPLALAAPVAALALGQPPELIVLTGASAALGGLGFAFTGALGAALALGARRGGLLIAVVFGAGALTRAASGQSPASALALLAAYVLFALVIAPIAGAAAVRNAQG